jgi:CubicO group peptidase (beta-lactamase class C family)
VGRPWLFGKKSSFKLGHYLVSTPNDMMIYLECNLGLLDTPLNSLLPALHTPATAVTTPKGELLGLGWFISTLRGSSIKVISKNGGVPAFHTQMFLAPSTTTGVFVLTNAPSFVNPGMIGSQVLQIINGLPATAAAPTGDQP